jgi:hypothetical protein
VQALNTLVDANGDPAIDGFFDKVKPLSSAEKTMITEASKRMNEATIKTAIGVDRWAHDASWIESQEALASRPTVNIQGLVGGYTGPGGMTIFRIAP